MARAGLRSRRAAADPGAGAVRSRHRHERLDVPAISSGTTATSRPRQGARARRRSRSSRSSIATSTRTATAFRIARCPGVHPKGAYFTRGSGPHAVRRLHRGLRRVPDRARPADASKWAHRQEARAAAPSSTRPRAATSASSRSAAAMARSARRIDVLSAQGVSVNYMRVRVVPVRRGRRAVPRVAPADVRRRAEPRRAVALAADARNARWRNRSCARCCTTAACRSPPSFIVEGVLAEVRTAAAQARSGASCGAQRRSA